MKISRRKFLSAAPIVAGTLMHLNGSALGQATDRMARSGPTVEFDRLSGLSWDSFYQFIHTDFKFGEGYNAVELTLVDMTDSRPISRQGNGVAENFVMKFQGPFNRPLTQGTYSVSHFNLGDFRLFITNGGRVRRNQYYIAVINRSFI